MTRHRSQPLKERPLVPNCHPMSCHLNCEILQSKLYQNHGLTFHLHNRMKPKVLVTGATGNLGTAVIKNLSTQYRTRVNVIAGVHPPNDPTPIRSRVSAVITTEYDEPSMEQALEGVQYLFFVPSHSANRATQFKKVLDHAKAQRVSFIILVSLLGCESRAGLFCSQFRDMEEHLENIEIPYTILQCAPFQQNMVALSANFKQKIGTIAMPIGAGGYSPIHVDDVAAAAGVIFNDPKPHFGKKYRLTGPEILSGVSIAGKASMGLDRPVKFLNCTKNEAKKSMLNSNSPAWVVNGFMELYELVSKGFFATVSPDLANLTFFKGLTVEEYFRENKTLFSSDSSANAGQFYVLPSKL
ncbi:hypothetical protein EDD86DRAFT_199747 [Gorgonomyces haynaldii]|nr:hypothetical protein EDD86DRAFT_199747 [Gorgonomyces haynaldii]